MKILYVTETLFAIVVITFLSVFAHEHHDHTDVKSGLETTKSDSVITRNTTAIPDSESSSAVDHSHHHQINATNSEHHDHASMKPSMHNHEMHDMADHEGHSKHDMESHSAESDKISSDYEHMINDQPPLDSINKLNKDESTSKHQQNHYHGDNHDNDEKNMNMDHSEMPHMMMMMFFHLGVDETVLFKEWKISNIGQMLGSIIGIIILGALYEGLKYFREYLFKRYVTSAQFSTVAVTGESGKSQEMHHTQSNRMLSLAHLIQTLLHVIQIVISYFLMLIFMTYNVWLCLAVIIGSAIGYFVFGWRKATVVDITEHCH